MAKEKKEQLTDQASRDALLADLSVAVASLSAQVQKLSASNAQTASQSGLAQTMAELISKSSSMRDTDVNAEEAMKAYSPMWGLKANMLFAQEFDKLTVANNQSTQILQNAISQANQIGAESIAAAGRRISMADKLLLATVNHPTYFAENAPAAQDTGGEGDDTGDK